MAASKFSELDRKHYVIIAAIDFGTTYSGYAFSFSNNPTRILMNKNWAGAEGFESYKTPTNVLTGPNNEFVAFGYEAEERYIQLQEDEKPGYNLFKHFKMILHKKQHLTRNTTISSVSGYRMPAMDIFLMSIRHLKDHLLRVVGEANKSKPNAKMVKWVITVPAIWREEAKNFMREAAYKAGCITQTNSSQLLIALEPEAAGIYCREMDLKDFSIADNVKKLAFKSQTKYLVIDAGGGTTDITAHEVLPSGDVKELLISNGGDWGGIQVDNAFVKLLENVLGADFINEYKVLSPQKWLSFIRSFERQKKRISHDETSRINCDLPWSMGVKYSEKYHKNIDAVINESSHLGISFRNGSLSLTHEASVGLFKQVIKNICDHIQGLFKQESLESLSYVILVGGFGESKILQMAIQNIIPSGLEFLVPYEGQLSVIRGAVTFAHNVRQIQSRKSRKTYGVDIVKKFIEGVHDHSKRKIIDDNAFCLYIFEELAKKGDSIQVGNKVRIQQTPLSLTQQKMSVELFCTDEDNLGSIEYVTDPKFKKLGEVTVDLPELSNITNRFDRQVEFEFEFGFTEIVATAKDLKTGQAAKVMCDFVQ